MLPIHDCSSFRWKLPRLRHIIISLITRNCFSLPSIVEFHPYLVPLVDFKVATRGSRLVIMGSWEHDSWHKQLLVALICSNVTLTSKYPQFPYLTRSHISGISSFWPYALPVPNPICHWLPDIDVVSHISVTPTWGRRREGGRWSPMVTLVTHGRYRWLRGAPLAPSHHMQTKIEAHMSNWFRLSLVEIKYCKYLCFLRVLHICKTLKRLSKAWKMVFGRMSLQISSYPIASQLWTSCEHKLISK